MKNLIKKYGGVILFYITIVGMVMAVSYRFEELNNINTNSEDLAYVVNP